MPRADAIFRTALAALEERRIPAALRLFDEAERAGSDPNACAAGRWNCHMMLGGFTEAWNESAAISARGSSDPQALWNGEPFRDRRVMVRCLHGFGDAIQFIRYIEPLRREASQVIVQTHPELVTLFRELPWADRVIDWAGEDRSLWDCQIEVMELPRAFGATPATIPRRIPYLKVPETIRSGARVPARSRRPRLGLQWSASAWDVARNISLAELTPVLEAALAAGYELLSFQRGTAREELAACRFPIADVSGDSPHVIEAAADLLHVDLLLTVDTMLAHLGGALGRPVWTLLPFQADWRWMLHREDTPWYPTMRLFRQKLQGDWSAPLQAAANCLAVVKEVSGVS